MSKQKHNFCTQHVLSLYFSGNSINNLLSYCGLTDASMRASEKDLPVNVAFFSDSTDAFVFFHWPCLYKTLNCQTLGYPRLAITSFYKPWTVKL